MTDSDLCRAMCLLNLTPGELLELRKGQTQAARQEALDSLKARAKRKYRQAACRLHPDKTGGDEGKTEDFKLITAFIEELERMEPPRILRRKPVRGAVFRINVTVRVPATR